MSETWRVSTDGIRGCVEGPRGRVCTDIVLVSDAHLIASAPDMLEALDAALGYLVMAGTDHAEPTRAVIRAAIKKARGEK